MDVDASLIELSFGMNIFPICGPFISSQLPARCLFVNRLICSNGNYGVKSRAYLLSRKTDVRFFSGGLTQHFTLLFLIYYSHFQTGNEYIRKINVRAIQK